MWCDGHLCSFFLSDLFLFSKSPDTRIILKFQDYLLPTLKKILSRQFFKAKRCDNFKLTLSGIIMVIILASMVQDGKV